MKPREYIDDTEYFPSTKLVNLGRYLRSINLWPRGHRKIEEHLTASHVTMATYLLGCDTTAKRFAQDLSNYTTIWSEDHQKALYVDVFNELFRKENQIQSLEISTSLKNPMVVLTTGIKKYSFSNKGGYYDIPVTNVTKIHQFYLENLRSKILSREECYADHPSKHDIFRELAKQRDIEKGEKK